MQVEWSLFHATYTAAGVRASVPRTAGVYLLWVKLQNGRWRCFYAGQADNLERRLLDHLSASEANQCIKAHVSKYTCGFEYAEVPQQAHRDGVEKYLYDHYKPECNDRDPGGVAIQVNLP